MNISGDFRRRNCMVLKTTSPEKFQEQEDQIEKKVKEINCKAHAHSYFNRTATVKRDKCSVGVKSPRSTLMVDK